MLTERGKQVRRAALKLMRENGLSHIGGSLSCTEILIALYDHVMTKDDIFILSKAHGCGAWYVLLREQGYSPKIEVHPHKDIKNGIHFTSGSLGHGLPFAIGIALAKKIKGEKGRVFVLVGDAECQEGTTYESVILLKKLRLDVKIIVDRNTLGGSCEVDLPDYINIISQNVDSSEYVDMVGFLENDQWFLVVETIKASGISFLENTVRSHSTWLTDEEYEKALEELR
jgi:transketolase